jgi:hypothetical protein
LESFEKTQQMMTISWSFEWTYALIIFVILLGFTWIDIKNYVKEQRWFRLVCYALLGVGLYALIVKPSILTKAPEAIVLINNSAEDISDSLLTNATHQFSNVASWLSSSGNLSTSKVILVGEGLSAKEAEVLDVPIEFYPSNIPDGIISIKNEPAFAGIPFNLDFDLWIEGPINLALIAPGMDTVRISVEQMKSDVSVRLAIPVEGNHLIHLVGTREGKEIFSNNYPLFVKQQPRVNVLVYSGYPSFELRYLSDYLRELGYQVNIRQSISKELENITEINVENGTVSLIKQIEKAQLILLDPESARNLSRYQWNMIRTQLEDGDTGILWLGSGDELRKYVPSVKTKEYQNKIEISASSTRVQLDARKNRIVGSELRVGHIVELGMGKLGQSIALNSYRLILQGQKQAYQAAWAEILDEIMGQVEEEFEISLSPYASVDWRTSGTISSEHPITIEIESVRIPTAQDMLRPNRFDFDYWPLSVGWQPILINGDTLRRQTYHADHHDWKTRTLFQSKQRTEMLEKINVGAGQHQNNIEEEINSWYIYLYVLIILGGLWLEQRIHS